MPDPIQSPSPSLLTGSAPVPAPLREFVEALVWARFGPAEQAFVTPLMPHGGALLVLSLPSPEPGPARERPVTSAVVRRLSDPGTTLRTRGHGCDALFALLKPRGALSLMQQARFGESPDSRVPLYALVGPTAVRRLGLAVERASLHGDNALCLRTVAQWLQQQCLNEYSGGPATLWRWVAAIERQPGVDLSQLHHTLGMGQRSVERHLRVWLGTTPRQQQRVMRLQQLARLGTGGQRLAELAAELGFADQAHLVRTVTRLTGMGARHFVQRMDTELSRAFREAGAGVNLMPCAFEPECPG
jgi:AraC-like DNA-binding protein